MQSKPHVLLASRSKLALTELISKVVANKRYKFDIRHVENGHADPLYGLSFVPDIVVMTVDDNGHADLEELIEAHAPDRPPFIVLAEQGDAKTMRLAMKAGARDFLPGKVTPEELFDSLDQITAQLSKREPESAQGSLTAVVNAKGGSGATFIACSVAHMLVSNSKYSAALLSLDMQFESLAQQFDVEMKHGLMDVLESAESLDAVALDAFLTHHESGLRLLAAQAENAMECGIDKAEQLGTLVDTLTDNYEHVIVDIPRRVDSYMASVLEKANRVVLVVQQTVSHLRDATRMMQIFHAYGISPEQILVVLNRYDKNASITADDVKRAVKDTDILAIPSDFRTVSESINLGIPIYDHSRGSAVTKALMELEVELSGGREEAEGGFFNKAFSKLRKDAWFRT